MEKATIFAPFFAMMMLTIVVWLYMYAKRIPFIQKSNLAPEQITPVELARISPPDVANPSDNLKNLFELPVIFYALILFLYSTNQADAIYIGFAWVFVGFRALHSLVHCTVNIILLRFGLYLISAFALWFIVFRAAISLF